MGSTRLRRFRSACVLREGAEVLRSGASLEVSQAVGAVGAGQDKTICSTKHRKKAGIEKIRPGSSRISSRINEKAWSALIRVNLWPGSCMASSAKSNLQWGNSYRLIASEKWKAKSAAMGRDVTAALVEYARPKPGMKILDLASGTG